MTAGREAEHGQARPPAPRVSPPYLGGSGVCAFKMLIVLCTRVCHKLLRTGHAHFGSCRLVCPSDSSSGLPVDQSLSLRSPLVEKWVVLSCAQVQQTRSERTCVLCPNPLGTCTGLRQALVWRCQLDRVFQNGPQRAAPAASAWLCGRARSLPPRQSWSHTAIRSRAGGPREIVRTPAATRGGLRAAPTEPEGPGEQRCFRVSQTRGRSARRPDLPQAPASWPHERPLCCRPLRGRFPRCFLTLSRAREEQEVQH